MPNTIPARDQIDPKYAWNAESVFASVKAWEDEVKKILTDISSVTTYKSRLNESPAVLLEALDSIEDLKRRAEVTYMYAGFSYAVDTTNQQAAGMRGKAQDMYGKILAAISFLNPGIISMGKSKLDEWAQQEPKLALYSQYLVMMKIFQKDKFQ